MEYDEESLLFPWNELSLDASDAFHHVVKALSILHRHQAAWSACFQEADACPEQQQDFWSQLGYEALARTVAFYDAFTSVLPPVDFKIAWVAEQVAAVPLLGEGAAACVFDCSQVEGWLPNVWPEGASGSALRCMPHPLLASAVTKAASKMPFADGLDTLQEQIRWFDKLFRDAGAEDLAAHFSHYEKEMQGFLEQAKCFAYLQPDVRLLERERGSYWFVSDEGGPWVMSGLLEAMPRAETDLFAWITNPKARPWPAARDAERRDCVCECRVASMLVAELWVLHAASVVHRDVKPENVLLFLNGACRLTDFEFAKQKGEAVTRRSGTWGFCAPEVLYPTQEQKDRGVQPAQDVWSMGVVLYNLFIQKSLLSAPEDGSVHVQQQDLIKAVYRTCSEDLEALAGGRSEAGVVEEGAAVSDPSVAERHVFNKVLLRFLRDKVFVEADKRCSTGYLLSLPFLFGLDFPSTEGRPTEGMNASLFSPEGPFPPSRLVEALDLARRPEHQHAGSRPNMST